MSSFTLVAADTLPEADLHAATVAAFADYLVGPFQMTLEQFPSFIGRQGIDLAHSRVAVRDGAVAAFAFNCPRPEVGRWRLGVMGALPSARGTGAAQALLDDFIARASAEGLPWVELECFAENERALRLYRSRGFDVIQGLNGWKLPEGAPASAPARDARAVDRAQALAWLADADQRIDWLPFPNSERCMAAQVRPLTFWQCGSAQLVFSVVDGTPTQIHSLIDREPGLRDAEVLARVVAATHPDVFAPPIFRDDLGGDALRRAGFAPHMMSQVLMNRRL
ncbi:GNAT family N-acetyltransferase [Scleromatobacter humisilvae]|uniref:GNAT family N-acetyltransferase n=1 Tax=Scleromatobacter humisilvae TaxID=2897159 RepID=A0A9X2C090_9BURK|nr:GNAT family N-acetyltransferase [Scleromatobacter humisilvae]MCK9684439.1 GNAT family N-acetyltransferase [Scleromatobacter humisilvae]